MTMTNDDQNFRWLSACHEAGHCVGALSLGGTVRGAMFNADGAIALIDVVPGDRAAYAVAAGPAAERLSMEYPPPSCEPVSLDEVAANPPKNCDSLFTLRCGAANIPGISRTLPLDERHLALWAITGWESEPDRWARRVSFAKHVANEIVEKNTEAIVRIAQELYARGALNAKEIKQLYAGQNENVG